jgi:hypothetical protein
MNHINSNKEGTFLNHFGMLDNLKGKERQEFFTARNDRRRAW